MSVKVSQKCCGINNDCSQTVKYSIPTFPVSVQQIRYPEELRFSAVDHWHDDLEFLYVTYGSLNICVDGTIMCLNQGQGIFINSRKLHVICKTQPSPSVFYCIILHPILLSASEFVDQTYIEPIIHNPCLSYLVLDSTVDWQKSVLDRLEDIFHASKEPYAAIVILKHFFDIWYSMSSHLTAGEEPKERTSHNLSTLKNMISFISNHYNEKLTLDDIAAAGNVGKTMCISIFSNYANKTPIEFLKEFRIQQSIDMLCTTDMSITEIAYETGFGGASYYTKVFRENIGQTPLEYRHTHGSIPA